MKEKIIYRCSLLLVFLGFSFASIANNPDAIVGLWKSGEGTAIIQIYKQGDAYFGKIVWLKVPNDPTTGKPKLDAKNDDPKARTKPLLGLINLRNFKFIKRTHGKRAKFMTQKQGTTIAVKLP